MYRNAQTVSTTSQRKIVIRRMTAQPEAQDNNHKIPSQAVNQFPAIFRYQRRTVNREKASDWRNRNSYLQKFAEQEQFTYTLSTSRREGPARTLIEEKAMIHRGRKRERWKLATRLCVYDLRGCALQVSRLHDHYSGLVSISYLILSI